MIEAVKEKQISEDQIIDFIQTSEDSAELQPRKPDISESVTMVASDKPDTGELVTMVASDKPDTGESVTPDKLWQNIIENSANPVLHKSITLTDHEVRELCSEDTKAPEHSRTDDVDDNGHIDRQCEAVLFTCGHHFTQQTFLQTVLPSFEANLLQAQNNLPHTARLLASYYRTKGYIPSACPQCVLSTLHNL